MEEPRPRSIVIVEDDEDIADSIRYNLERESFRVRVAATGEEALDLILERPPSLVLLDLNLPNLIITPHVAWASREAVQTLADQVIDNIEGFVAGRPQNLLT